MSTPRAYVVVLNWNGYEDTIECLGSLLRMTYPNFRIVVVDNGSGSDEGKRIREWGRDAIAVIENGEDLGFAEGMNVGVRYALGEGAEYVCYMGNDSIVAPDLLERLVSAAEADERVGIVSPGGFEAERPEVQHYPRGVDTWPPWLYFLLGSSLLGVAHRAPIQESREVQHFYGNCALFRRRFLEAARLSERLLDPEYFLGGYETLAVVRKAQQAGYRIVAVPEARLWHKCRRSMGSRRAAASGQA